MKPGPTMPGSTEERGRRAFWPTLALGVGSAVTAVVAANKPLVISPLLADDRAADLGEVPLAGSLAVIPLIAWVALLVLRGTWRRLAASLGVIGSVGTVMAADAGLDDASRAVGDAVISLGSQGDVIITEYSTWFWALMVAAILSALAFAVAWRHAPQWPGMSRRYEAPGATSAPAEPSTNQELWKAMDEGRDPTADNRSHDN